MIENASTKLSKLWSDLVALFSRHLTTLDRGVYPPLECGLEESGLATTQGDAT
jgi:hypothetical protein